MAARLFGTDGVRGIANTELSPELAFRLGQAAAVFCGRRIVIGKDTRKSGDMLEAALVAGATSSGADVYLAGIIPTPAVALLARELKMDGGIVVSASHNPPEYNGIKFFSGEGFKLGADTEDSIESFLHDRSIEVVRGIGGDVGSTYVLGNAESRYVKHAIGTLPEDATSFHKIKVVVDCAHGASAVTTPDALSRLGANVIVMNQGHDGTDINVGCGSTHLEALAERVVAEHADIGIAHDGDADRMLAVTETGEEMDGDTIMAICAIDLAERGLLSGDKVVATVMSNMGFAKAMSEHGISVETAQVGDRNVLELMREKGCSLGGEQSGHIIFLDHATTGDGLITALQLIAAMVRRHCSASQLAQSMRHYPQVLVNVPVKDKEALDGNVVIGAAIHRAEVALSGTGRVLVRPSGTEPLVRVMAEAASEGDAKMAAHEIADVVRSELS